MLYIRNGKLQLPQVLQNRKTYPELNAALKKFNPIHNDFLNIDAGSYSGSLSNMIKNQPADIPYKTNWNELYNIGDADKYNIVKPGGNGTEGPVKPYGAYGLTQYQAGDVMCPDPTACNYQQYGRCVYPDDKGGCPDSFIQGSSGDFGVQNDCCDEVDILENTIEELQLENLMLQTQIDAGMGIDFLQGGLTDEDGTLLLNPSGQEITYTQLMQAYNCLYNYYTYLYDEYVYATTVCLQASNYLGGSGWGPSITMGGPGSAANDNMINDLATGPAIVYDFDPNYPVLGYWDELGLPGNASPYNQGGPGNPETTIVNLATWLDGGTPNFHLRSPFISPRLFNIDLPPIGGTNDCSNFMPNNISTVLQDILNALNQNDNISIYYAGADPEYQNAMYLNVFAGMQSALSAAELLNDELEEENAELSNLINVTQATLDQAIDDLQAAMDANEVLQADIAVLEAAIEALALEFEDFADLTEEQIEALILDYENQLSQADSNYALLEEMYNQLETYFSEAQGEISGLESALQTAQNTINTMEGVVGNLTSAMDDLSDTYVQAQEEWQATFDEQLQVIMDAQQTIIDISAELATANAYSGSLEAYILQLEEIKFNLETVFIPDLEDQISDLEAALLLAETSNTSLADTILDLIAANQELVTQAEEDLIAITTMSGQLELAADTWDQLQEATEELENCSTITQADVDAATAAAYTDGVNSVSITSDNQSAIAEATAVGTPLYNEIFNAGVASVNQDFTESDLEQAYNQGVTSVDITSDNQEVIADAINALPYNFTEEEYNSLITAAQEAVDITIDNEGAFNDGVASVDITSDNQEVIADAINALPYNFTEEEFNNLVSSIQDAVDITVDNEGVYNQGYALGLADGAGDVDITSDNQAIADAAYAEGYAAGAASVIPEDGITQADVDEAVEQLFSQADMDQAFALGQADGAASITPEDGISQADVDEAYALGQADGAASITPEDGISQADVDAAFDQGVASVIQTFTQTDIDAAYDAGVLSVTPEDGIGQADVDAAYADGVNSVIPDDGIGQADVDAAYADGVASVVPDDGIGQADLDAAYEQGRAEGLMAGAADALAACEIGGYGLTQLMQETLEEIMLDPETWCAGQGYMMESGLTTYTPPTESARPPASSDSNRPMVKLLNELVAYAQRLESQLGIRPSNVDNIKPNGLNNSTIKPGSLNNSTIKPNGVNIKPIKRRR